MPIREIPEVAMQSMPEMTETDLGLKNVVDSNQLTLELNIETQQQPTHTQNKGANNG